MKLISTPTSPRERGVSQLGEGEKRLNECYTVNDWESAPSPYLNHTFFTRDSWLVTLEQLQTLLNVCVYIPNHLEAAELEMTAASWFIRVTLLPLMSFWRAALYTQSFSAACERATAIHLSGHRYSREDTKFIICCASVRAPYWGGQDLPENKYNVPWEMPISRQNQQKFNIIVGTCQM